MEETLKERQEEEITVVQSIYGEEFVKDLRENDAWKIARAPEVVVSLQPQESMAGTEAFVAVDLHVKCGSVYPEQEPEIILENPKGLSNQHLKVLGDELNVLAKKLIGEVMIMDLAQHVQKFLHVHNKPSSKSFYDEMLSNKKLQEEKQRMEQQKRLEIEQRIMEKKEREIEDEIERRTEALRQETRQRKQRTKENMMIDLEPSGTPAMSPIKRGVSKERGSISPEHRRASSGHKNKSERRRRTSTPLCSESDRNDGGSSECQEHRGTQLITFRNQKEKIMQRGACIEHRDRGNTIFVGLDVQTGELLTISEWVLKWRHTPKISKEEDDFLSGKYLNQVVEIEQEFLRLAKFRHPHLVQFHAINYFRDAGKVIVQLLIEHCGGGNLDVYIKESRPIPLEQLRTYIVCFLDALSFLHKRAVCHGNIQSTSLLLDGTGTLKVGDYCIEKRLHDLLSSMKSQNSGGSVHFADEIQKNDNMNGKKGDIHKLGTVILSLVKGSDSHSYVNFIPKTLPLELQDFITRCLDENEPPSTTLLQEHSFLKTPLYKLLRSSRHTETGLEIKKATQYNDQDKDEDSHIPFLPSSHTGHSRLHSEFEILKWLGKGGFGDVIKVQNKLDGRNYAIKRISLNTKSKQFKRKITREVKLLSSLNHENVVRYYNSWIELSDEPTSVDSSSDNLSSSVAPSISDPVTTGLYNSLGLRDDFDAKAARSLAPEEAAAEWSKWSNSISDVAGEQDDEFSSDEDGFEDIGGVFGPSFIGKFDNSESDDDVVFEGKSPPEDTSLEESSSGKTPSDDQDSDKRKPMKIQFLYIQMEFCEKSTLRNIIDEGLYQDMDRVWRYFREILEGLAHIHDQGMIHRDLKPVNIFLDSNDHIKIGDFGLATTDIINLQQSNLKDLTLNLEKSAVADINVVSNSESLGDGNLTGKVGSALYVAPEILTTTRSHYNQKVDIYSAGIMFFEMCYRPLMTGMERVKTLSSLRIPQIQFPSDYDEVELSNQKEIISWMLNHDANQRPTAQELLQSNFLPPPIFEEGELFELLRSTLADPDGRSYRVMTNSIMRQPVNPATEFTYDLDMFKSRFQLLPHLLQRRVAQKVETIFLRHGGVSVKTPLLMPKSMFYDNADQYVMLMDRSGGIVSLPYDLRIPFARYVARNEISHLKRYCIDQVFREKKLPHLHPRELTECAFDIVTPSPTMGVTEAELISIIREILQEFPSLQGQHYYVQLNHINLLQAILLHCGIPEDQHSHVLTILGETKNEKGKAMQLQTRLCSLSITDQNVIDLLKFMEKEETIQQMSSYLRCITKRPGQAGIIAKKALKELETIIINAEAMGCSDMQFSVSLGMVYNSHIFSGAIFQVVTHIKRKKKTLIDVLAAGGGYSNLVKRFQRASRLRKQSTHEHLVPVTTGISLSLDRLLASIMECQTELDNLFPIDILVCSLGRKGLVKEKLSILRQLWSHGCFADIVHNTSLDLEEIQDYCKKSGIQHLVIIKDIEQDSVRVKSFDKEKTSEKKFVNLSQGGMLGFLEHVKQYSSQNEVLDVGGSNSGSDKKTLMMFQASGEGVSGSSSSGNHPLVNVTIYPSDSKMAYVTRRRQESQIYNCTASLLSTFASKARIEIMGLEVEISVIKNIVAYLDVDDEEALLSSKQTIIESNSRLKKYLHKVLDAISDLKFNKKCPVIILYSLKDDLYRVLT